MTDDGSAWYPRPVFFVAECDAALAFSSRLGFREAWRHGEDDELVALQVERDGVEVILNRAARRAGGGRVFVSLEPGAVAVCVAEFEAAGIAVRDDRWGMPVKVVVDPDGNDLVLYGDELG